MTKSVTAAACALALALSAAGCGGGSPSPDQSKVAASADCAVEADFPWTPAGPPVGYVIVAETSGATCSEAVAQLRIELTSERVLYSAERPVADMPVVFAEADTKEKLTAALRDWAAPGDRAQRRTSDLPVWAPGQPQPGADQEFPFYPADNMTQESYEAIRAAALPMYCFVQGAESEMCVALENGGQSVREIGNQSFPG